MDSIPNHKHSGPPKQPGPVSIQSHPLRWGFGAVLFLAWGIATIIWVASTVYSVAHGDVTSAVTAVVALALLALLGGMEGLEVAVIDRWQEVWPGQSTSDLAGWLAARQLFVALIVTAAALLANRSVIVVPGTSTRITNGFTLDAFDLVWTTLTVLWAAMVGAAAITVPDLVRRTATPRAVVRAVEPPFLVFVLGLGVIVAAASDNGLAEAMRTVLPAGGSLPDLLRIAAVAAVLANLVNNVPAILILAPILAPAGHGPVLAALVGVNVGPNLTYVGSLATLLWRRILRAEDTEVNVAEFHRLGAVTVPAALVASTLLLWLVMRVGG